MFLPWRLIQFYVEFVGRSLFTSTLVADLMLLMSHSVWHNLRRFAQTETAAQYDEMMEQVGTALRQN